MKVNAALVLEQRLGRAWTQEELAIASGLSHRTIQRVEKGASGSLEKKTLAAIFEVDIADLNYEDLPTVKSMNIKLLKCRSNLEFSNKERQT